MIVTGITVTTHERHGITNHPDRHLRSKNFCYVGPCRVKGLCTGAQAKGLRYKDACLLEMIQNNDFGHGQLASARSCFLCGLAYSHKHGDHMILRQIDEPSDRFKVEPIHGA